jgi:hypothetical protein
LRSVSGIRYDDDFRTPLAARLLLLIFLRLRRFCCAVVAERPRLTAAAGAVGVEVVAAAASLLLLFLFLFQVMADSTKLTDRVMSSNAPMRADPISSGKMDDVEASSSLLLLLNSVSTVVAAEESHVCKTPFSSSMTLATPRPPPFRVDDDVDVGRFWVAIQKQDPIVPESILLLAFLLLLLLLLLMILLRSAS